MPKKILIVDDEPEPIEVYREVFSLKGYAVEQASQAAEALEKIEEFKPDLVTLDINFGFGRENEGVNIVKLIRARWPLEELPILIVSGYGTSADFLDAKQNGANAVVLKSKVENVLLKIEELLSQPINPDELVVKPWTDRMRGKGTNDTMVKLLEYADRDCDVLILGETGTGKSLAAETYRLASRRKDKFYRIDCAALPENLMQTELFGAEPGGFTGAKPRKGKLEEANHGIVFLDEIGELTPNQQKVLLTFLDTREITPVGSNRKIKLDVVVLTATNRDLVALEKEQHFRPDLLRRLWHNTIRMPALRETRQDIPILVDAFIRQFNQKYRKKVLEVDPDVLGLFQRLPWRGNTGELRNCISHGVLNASGSVIRAEDILSFLRPDDVALLQAGELSGGVVEKTWASIHDLRQKQDEEEKKYLKMRYIENNCNQTNTAKSLGISRERCIQLLKKHKII